MQRAFRHNHRPVSLFGTRPALGTAHMAIRNRPGVHSRLILLLRPVALVPL